MHHSPIRGLGKPTATRAELAQGDADFRRLAHGARTARLAAAAAAASPFYRKPLLPGSRAIAPLERDAALQWAADARAAELQRHKVSGSASVRPPPSADTPTNSALGVPPFAAFGSRTPTEAALVRPSPFGSGDSRRGR